MNLALLALRLAVGLGFAAHGSQKLFGAFGGGGIEGTAESFEQLGLCPDRLHARAAGTAEFFGGGLLALLARIGPGNWSLDNVLNIELTGTGWALSALGAGVLAGIGAVLSGRFASQRGRPHGQPGTG